MLQRIKKQDWIITGIAFILSFLSIILIFSTTYNAQNPLQGQNTIYKQIIFFITGFIFYFIFSSIKLSWLKERTIVIIIYLFIFFSLLYVLTFGEVIQQTQRWILLGPFSFQPAEFAKLAIVIITAYIFSYDLDEIEKNKKEYEELNSKHNLNKLYQKNFLKKFIINAILACIYFLLIFIQPSLGNAIIFILIWITLIFLIVPISNKTIIIIISTITALLAYYKFYFFNNIAQFSSLTDLQWKVFVFFAFVVIAIALYLLFKFNKLILILSIAFVITFMPILEISWNNILKDYHRERIEAFADGFSSEPRDRDYQIRQSISTFGSGQLLGQGYMQTINSSATTLPFSHTDFIFAALGNQFGFIGVIMLYSIYLLLFYRIFQIFTNTYDMFGKIIIIGCTMIIIYNVIINSAMVMALMPVTGVPLSFISYGGSSILLMLIALSLIQIVKISTKSTDLSKKIY